MKDQIFAAVNAMLVDSGQILDDGSIADFVLQGTITSSVHWEDW